MFSVGGHGIAHVRLCLTGSEWDGWPIAAVHAHSTG